MKSVGRARANSFISISLPSPSSRDSEVSIYFPHGRDELWLRRHTCPESPVLEAVTSVSRFSRLWTAAYFYPVTSSLRPVMGQRARKDSDHKTKANQASKAQAVVTVSSHTSLLHLQVTSRRVWLCCGCRGECLPEPLLEFVFVVVVVVHHGFFFFWHQFLFFGHTHSMYDLSSPTWD